MIMALPMVTACNHDDDRIDYTEYYDWRDQNMALTMMLDSIQRSDSALTYFNQSVRSLKEPAHWPSYYHYVHRAPLDSLRALSPRRDYRPYSTSTLSVHYTLFKTASVMDHIEGYLASSGKGRVEAMRDLMRNPGGIVDSIFFANAADNTLKADTLESYQVQFFTGFTPNTVVNGWGDILQQMYIGDHVVCMIPWFLGYGQSGSGSKIPPYTNLFFRIELCDITSWGGTVE